MKNVVFTNRKGGVGKSTLCAEFVLSVRRSGIPINFYDLDVQGGTIITVGEEKGAKISAVDTPGAMEKDLPEWIQEADVVVIPTIASELDIESLLHMVSVYQAHKKRGSKLIIVVNQFTHYTSGKQFMEWITEEMKGTGAEILTMMRSEKIIQATANSKSVVEYAPRSAAASSALVVVNAIRKAAKLPEE